MNAAGGSAKSAPSSGGGWIPSNLGARTSSAGIASPTLVKGLQILGIPNREARLYLALLRYGPGGAREAAQHAGLNRATAYRVLLRLLSRGLVLGDGRSPQKFHALSIEVAMRRLGTFLREEEELNTQMAEAWTRWSLAAHTDPGIPSLGNGDPSSLLPRDLTASPLTQEIGEARQSIEVAFRPLSVGIAFRTALTRLLARSARAGVRVRILVDAGPSDRRFVERVLREAGGSSPNLEIRHYTPLGTHFYILDSYRLIRVPTLGVIGRASEFAVACEIPTTVRTQLARFEGVWREATNAVSHRGSTRGFGWRSPSPPPPPSAPSRLTYFTAMPHEPLRAVGSGTTSLTRRIDPARS